jgi:hypothetical protein
LPRAPSPPDPHAAGWGWSFSLCRARSLGRDAVVLGGHGPGRQPLRRRQPPARQVLDYIKTKSTSPAAGCCRSACYATPSTSPVPTGHRLFLPPARCHRDRAVLRGHPPPRGACQDRLRQRRGPIPPGLVATAHPPTRRCGQNAKPGRLRAPVQRAYRTLRSAPNVSHAPTLQPPRRTAAPRALSSSAFVT